MYGTKVQSNLIFVTGKINIINVFGMAIDSIETFDIVNEHLMSSGNVCNCVLMNYYQLGQCYIYLHLIWRDIDTLQILA